MLSGSIDLVQKKLGVPASNKWDPLTLGALVAYQSSGAGKYPMAPTGHPDPPTLMNLDYYNGVDELAEPWADYVNGDGKHPGTVWRDLGASGSQVPQWTWFAVAALFIGVGVWTWHKSRA